MVTADAAGKLVAGGSANVIVSDPAAGVSQSITAADPADVPLNIKGAAGQTGDLQQWSDDAGKVLASVKADGSFAVNEGGKDITSAAKKAEFYVDGWEGSVQLNSASDLINIALSASGTVRAASENANTILSGSNAAGHFALRTPGTTGVEIIGAAGQTADYLQLGVNKLVVKANGRVGIGNPSPVYPLVVSDAAGSGLEIAPSTAKQSVRLISFDRSGGKYTSFDIEASSFSMKSGAVTTRVKLDPSGSFGIGTDTPTAGLDIDTATMAGGTGKIGIRLVVNTGQTVDLVQIDTDKFVVKADGKVGIGTDAPDAAVMLDVAGPIKSTAALVVSDRRLKDNLEPVKDATAKLNQITGYEYDLKGKRSAGLIAQEVEAILPQAVSTGSDGMKSLDYNQTLAVLVEALKEANARITKLEEQINA